MAHLRNEAKAVRLMGVEFNADEMRYVVIDDLGGDVTITASNKLVLGDTRTRSALTAFQAALISTLNGANPERIAIKTKPETGRMKAGAAALKMEGLLLASARCDVEFVSGTRISRTEGIENNLHVYLQLALKAALAARD